MRSKSNLSAASCPQLQQHNRQVQEIFKARICKKIHRFTSIHQVCLCLHLVTVVPSGIVERKNFWSAEWEKSEDRTRWINWQTDIKLTIRIPNCFHQERREKGTTVWRHRVAQPETCTVELRLWWLKGSQKELRVERKIDEKAWEELYGLNLIIQTYSHDVVSWYLTTAVSSTYFSILTASHSIQWKNALKPGTSDLRRWNLQRSRWAA